MIIRLIQQKVFIGSEVSIFLKDGKEIRGTLIEIGEMHITIRNAGGEEILLGDVIGRFQVHAKNNVLENVIVNRQESSATLENTSPFLDQSLSPEPESLKKIAPLPQHSLEVITQVIEIEARFKVAIQQSNLVAIPSDFSTPKEISSLSFGKKRTDLLRDWNKLQSRYNNAIKLKDLGRLNQIIDDYEVVLEKHTNIPSAWFTLGCLYLDLKQFNEAIEVFETGVTQSPDSKTFYNLAVASLLARNNAKASYALQEFFKRSTITESSTAWYKFLELSLESGSILILVEFLKRSLNQQQVNDTKLILESVVFVLKTNGEVEDSHSLMAFLMEKNFDSNEVIPLVTSMLEKLRLEPTDSFLAQQHKLQEAAKQLQKDREESQKKEEIKNFIRSAEYLANQKKYALALSEINKALRLDNENAVAKQLKIHYQESSREQTLPKGRGAYARAKYAEQEKDYKKAEMLLREAIKTDDKTESAVKDLASLLQTLDRDKEAISLLRGFRDKASDKISIDNKLINVYQHAKMYADAISLLNNRLLSTRELSKRVDLLKQISVCQFRSQNFDESESTILKLLKLSPNDSVAKRWLDGLRQAKKTGFYAPLNEIFMIQEVLTEFATNVSKFLTFYLDRCEYQGVNEAKISTRSFSEEDVRKLRGLIEGAGRKRPGLRAQHNLSAAKILIDLDSEEDQKKVRFFIQDYALDMGDSSLLDQKHQDVVLAYFSEAFLIAPQWHSKLGERLSRAIMLFHQKSNEESNLPKPEKCLLEALKTVRGRVLVEWLLEISLNHPVAEYLLTLANTEIGLKEKMRSFCYEILGEEKHTSIELPKLWERTRELLRSRSQELVNELVYLRSQSTTGSLGILQDHLERVQTLGQKIRGALDKQRLVEINKVLGRMTEYTQQQSYVERERLATIIKNTINDITEEIEKSPTKHSLELFHPYLLSLGEIVESHFNEVQKEAEPNQLINELSIDSYTPDLDSRIECQITIRNEQGKSPVNAILIQVKESPTHEYVLEKKSINVTEALPGGQSITCQIPLSVTERAINFQVFTLYYQMSFTTRTGKQIQIDSTQPIKLYPVTDFQNIDNPYVYAQGSAVKDEKMFYGREQLIANLLSSIRNISSDKSFVIYGQKRAGKSSVLYHLQKQLQLPIIPVPFSVGDIIGDCSITPFLYTIIQAIENTFEEIDENAFEYIKSQRPSIEDLNQYPQQKFQDYIINLKRFFRSTEIYKDIRIVLLIDEFSYIFGEIKSGRIPPTFMKSWKALLEKRYFGAVLVGQDNMPQFIESFPNEFQVSESQRVSYLAHDEARKLIIDPIRILVTGESRYKGEAVSRLIELTAGSPYYIQIFCNRLVEYMNRKKAIYVTDADIERVKEDLISGNNSLGGAVFDNLTSAADNSTDSIPKKDAESILRDVANGSRTQQYCDRSAIIAKTLVPIDQILEDLVKREVLEKSQSSLFRIRVSLFKEWLLAHQ